MKNTGSRLSVALVITAMLFVSFGSSAQDDGTAPPARGTSRGFGQGGFRGGSPIAGRGAPPQAPSDAEMLPARFQATVYEVEVLTNRSAALDARKLAEQASTTETLLKALGEVGKSRVLYRIDQPVNVFSDRISMGSIEPIARPNLAATGQTSTTYALQNLGMSMLLSALTPPNGAQGAGTNMAITIQFSTMASSDVEIGPGQRAPVIRSQAMRHSEPLEFGKPRVMLSVGPASSGDQSAEFAYIVRYLFRTEDSK